MVMLVLCGASSLLRKLAVTTASPRFASPRAMVGWESRSPYEKMSPWMNSTAARKEEELCRR